MTFLLCGLFHVSAKWHSEKHHISLHTQSLSSAHSILLCLLKRHPILYSFTLRITLGAGRSLCAEILNSNGSYPVAICYNSKFEICKSQINNLNFKLNKLLAIFYLANICLGILTSCNFISSKNPACNFPAMET